MKIYSVEFKPMWPVGGCLVIAANSLEEANKIARETIKHTDKIEKAVEVDISKPCVIEYLSGNY